MNVVLTLFAFLCVALLTPFCIVYTLVFKRKKVGDYFYSIAVSLDQLGNVTCQYPLSYLLVKKGGYMCGDEDKTISYVLGINKQQNTLTKTGIWLADFLNKRDKNHVELAVQNENK